jgi:hypothetical protein
VLAEVALVMFSNFFLFVGHTLNYGQKILKLFAFHGIEVKGTEKFHLITSLLSMLHG